MLKDTVITLVSVGFLFCLMCQQEHSCTNRRNTDNSVDTILAVDTVLVVDTISGFSPISNQDLWLEISPSDVKSKQSKRLVDAYNAAVVMNSIITDFDLQLRFEDEYDNVVDAIKSMDINQVKDPETLSKLKDYKEEMLYLLSVNPNDVDQNVHNPWKANAELYKYLAKRYHIDTFGKLDEDEQWEKYMNCLSVPEWKELIKRRGEVNRVKELMKKYLNAKDFDARCVYAIELSHAYEADEESWESYFNPAIPIMESLMNEGKYSLYLRELWKKWRVLYQDATGASKDSEIPNGLYNMYRNKCACTFLSHIEKHPEDIMAINEFLNIAYIGNILREGEFSLGNQYIIEKYKFFNIYQIDY